jgi:DNA mismatch repair protein MutL
LQKTKFNLTDIIHLLPDHIANQIAAGEVIQRPASAVKELLENAVDAGATEVHLLVNDAGKALIQVIDNGKGMSQTDARMAFERHATSKISNIDDLFSIKTMGFRGEALASIAAVAQVEVKTKKVDDELGTYLEIEHSNVLKQEPIACANGTSIAMKNLFFNVPARRNFLKSNTTELKNIIDEFTRVAMAFPAVHFKLTNNNQQLFYVESGTLKQRIIQLMGNNYQTKLVSVKEETDYMNVFGFIGKPEMAKKTRGDQYFFVNNRFIKSAYLNHAVANAFNEMLQKDSYPSYFLFIEVDPAQVDINVHPTKQEIKFEDEKLIYAFVSAAVKHSLAQFSIAPTLDFELDANIQQLSSISQPFTEARKTEIYASPLYQTFTQKNQAHKIEHSGNLKSWENFFTPTPQKNNTPSFNNNNDATIQEAAFQNNETVATSNVTPNKILIEEHQLHQIANTYILYDNGNGFIVIQQQYAHQRIIYDRLIALQNGAKVPVQQSMFPETIDLQPADAILLTDLLDDINALGYHIEPFGNNSFVLHGTPADIVNPQGKKDIETMLEHFKNYSNQHKLSKREQLALTLCWQQSIKPNTVLSKKEMLQLVNDLYSSTQPNSSPFGKNIILQVEQSYLQKVFS